MSISLSELREKLKPDVMGWINQALQNAVLTGIEITIPDYYARKNEIQTFTVLQYFADDIIVASSGDSSVIIDSGLPSNAGVSNIILRSQGTDKANVSINTATSGQPLEINSAYAGDVSLVVGGGKVGIGDNAPDSGLEIAAMSGAGYFTLNEITAPGSPAANKLAFYTADDGAGNTVPYAKNSAGTVFEMAVAGGGGLPAATQAEMEAGTSTITASTPGRQQYHPSAAKAWVNYDQTGTLTVNASYNVTSVTDTDTGKATVNWDVDFSSANYAVVGTAMETGGNAEAAVSISPSGLAAGSAVILTRRTGGTVQDMDIVCVAAYGDQ